MKCCDECGHEGEPYACYVCPGCGAERGALGPLVAAARRVVKIRTVWPGLGALIKAIDELAAALEEHE